MIITGEEKSTIETGQRKATPVKFSDFLFLSEPVWVLIAASFVYISHTFDWASFIPWLCLALAFSPFILRAIRYGKPSRQSAFDIPIAILLCSMILGMSVSDHLDISLGAFQTFLAATACYYSFINYSRPSRLVAIWIIAAAATATVTLVIGAKWFFSDIHVPNGIGIALAIIIAVALGTIVFSGRTVLQVVTGILATIFIGVTALFTHDSIYRLFTLVSIEKRMKLWLRVINPIEGSSLWTGSGLGCWPLSFEQGDYYYRHVHNAYLEIYVNTGILGLLALICFLAVGAKLAADILYSNRNNPYYGFGAGVILASLVVLAAGFIESVPFGFGVTTGGNYYYLFSPIPFILAAALVVARRLLREGSPVANVNDPEA